MRKIRWKYSDFEFQEDDPDLGCFEKLLELERNGELEEIDVNIISSMFELHRELPSLVQTLFQHGFTLPKNEQSFGDVDAMWKHQDAKGESRTLKYIQKMWDTMWGRSDHYHIDIEYQAKDGLTAIHVFRMCEDDYGRTKTHENKCVIKKEDKVIFEYTKTL